MCTGDMFDSFANNWQVEQAYAQILTHPDVPSVYWKHYFDWGSDLQNKVKALINARKMVGDTTDGQPWKDRSVTFLKNHGTPQKDQPMLLRPGDHTDKIPTDVDRIVTVYDARSNRVLFRDVLRADPKNPRGYSIVPDQQATNKVRLVQVQRKGK